MVRFVWQNKIFSVACFVRQNKGIRRFLGHPAAFWSVLGLTAASWDVLGGILELPGVSWGFHGLLLWLPGPSCPILRASCAFLGPPAAFWGLLLIFLGLLRFSGLPAGFWGFLGLASWWACCGFLGPPAVFWGLLGFLRLPMASLGRRPGLAVWLVESFRMLHFLGTLQSGSCSSNYSS